MKDMTTETDDREIVIAEAAIAEAPLTTTEQQDLERCETVIGRGLETFVEVGAALAEIRDKRLYRQAHASFADYLQEKWPQIGSRRQADRLIAAADVAADLRPMGLTLENERQARPLASLAPEERRQAMQQAVAAAPSGKPNAKQIQQAAEQVRPKPATPPPQPATLPPTLPTAPAAATPAPALPPALPSLTAAVAAGVDVQARKLLVAKHALLAAALDLVGQELARTSGQTIVVQQDRAVEAARLFVNNPALGGAAAMLAFSAVVEEEVAA